jgi:excinuclease UvrABC nuclease subunit
MRNRINFALALPDDPQLPSWESLPHGKVIDPAQTHTETIHQGTVANTKELDTVFDYLEAAKYSAVAMQDFELAAAIRDLIDQKEAK